MMRACGIRLRHAATSLGPPSPAIRSPAIRSLAFTSLAAPNLAAPILAATGDSSGQAVEITWQHTWPWPFWATLVVISLAAALIIGAYLCQRGPTRRRVRLLLAALRISLLGLLLFMMYGWMIHPQRTDQPDLVIAVDVSESMSVQDEYRSPNLQAHVDRRIRDANLTSPTRLNLGKSLLLDSEHGWLRALENRYHLKPFFVGNDAQRQSDDLDALALDLPQRDATDGASRLGINLLQILQAQRGRPTAAIIVLTDGATTTGLSLAEAAEFARKRSIPLFLVGIGNETAPRDASVSDLLTDDIVFVDDIVNFDFTVRASGYQGQAGTVQLRAEGSSRVLAEQAIELAADGMPQTVRLTHRPRDEGVIEYVVELRALKGEINVDNNRLTRRIDVRDSTIRVLMVQAYPNYEFRSLKNLLGRAVKSARNTDKAIDLTTILQTADVEHAEQDANARTDFPVTREELFSFDVVIFGDVNPAFLGNSMMAHLADFVSERGGGVVFLCGQQFTPQAYHDTPLAPLFPFAIETASVPDPAIPLTDSYHIRPTPLGLETPHLQLGDTRTASESVWSELDGMFWLLETPDVNPAARVLATHPIRTSDQGELLPAILMQFVGAGKVVAHNIDETYFWSRHAGRQQHYNRYWLQLLRYLSRGKLLADDEPVQVVTDRNEYQTGETVRISLRLAAGLSEFGDASPVTLMIQHENGSRREVTLSRDAVRGIFSGSVTVLNPGTYRLWLVSPQFTPPPVAQAIRVVSPQSELTHLQMNVTDLQLAAKRTGGRFYSIHAADRLLRDLPRGRQVPIESLPAIPIWNSSALAGLFIALITIEWLLRKRLGMV